MKYLAQILILFGWGFIGVANADPSHITILLSNNKIIDGINNAGMTVGTVSVSINPKKNRFTGTLALNGPTGDVFVFATPISGCSLIDVQTITCSNVTTNIPLVTLAIGSMNLVQGNYNITISASGG